MELAQDILKSILHYNPDTGIFTRLVSRATVKAGDIAGCLNDDGYVRISVMSHTYKAHRLAFLYMEGSFPDGPVEHRDCIRSNNRWGNLKSSTTLENNNNPITRARMSAARLKPREIHP
jgi:hypothetical protein